MLAVLAKSHGILPGPSPACSLGKTAWDQREHITGAESGERSVPGSIKCGKEICGNSVRERQ